MYATSSPGDAYHLLADANDQTLCGLSVAPIVIDRPTKTQLLYLISERPNHRPLCDACAKIELDQLQTASGRERVQYSTQEGVVSISRSSF